MSPLLLTLALATLLLMAAYARHDYRTYHRAYRAASRRRAQRQNASW